MGKFDRLARFLGLKASEYGDDAVKILEKIDTPEFAVTLKGEPRAQYLKALDEVYGDQAKRAADMGFGPETYYHGTKNKFDKFKTSSGGNAGMGVYLTEHENIAERYMPDKGAMFKGRARNKNILDLTVNDEIGFCKCTKDSRPAWHWRPIFQLKDQGKSILRLNVGLREKYPEVFAGLKGSEREAAFTDK
jgi:hypothetical protein